MSKRKDRKRSSSERQDYRKGGRVGYQEGGRFEYDQISGLKNQQAYDPVAAAKAAEDAAAKAAADAEKKAAEEAAKAAEEAKKAELRQSIDDAAAGKVPESAVIGTPAQAGIDPVTGQPLPEQKVTTMAAPTTVTAQPAPGVAPEKVTTVDQTAQAQTPEQIQAAQMEAAKVDTDAQVEAAKGVVSDDAIAQAAGVERVPTIQAADVEIPEGALTERVVGTLSPEAQSTAVMNVGSSLARITRAKKQLANAGLSDADITELGNDPEALEARLSDFSEAERGIIS